MSSCKYCDHDALVERMETSQVPFGDDTVTVEIRTSICGHCNRGQITPEQAKANKRAINEAKRAALGLPSKVELQKMRLRWKMTQATAGTLFGVGTTAFCKYEMGEILPSAPTARLLYVASRDDHTMMALVRKYGQELKITPPVELRERPTTSFNVDVKVSLAMTVIVAVGSSIPLDGYRFPVEEHNLPSKYLELDDGLITSAPQLQAPDKAASPYFSFPISLTDKNGKNCFSKI